jgi:hypothetical protein
VELRAGDVELIVGVLAQFSDEPVIGLQGIEQRASDNDQNGICRFELANSPLLLRD